MIRRIYVNPGPNFVWHVDSYDKLKPYGICINRAIDGFSRLIVWLHAYSANNNPKVISSYFLAEAEKRMGTPAKIQADLGTDLRFFGQAARFVYVLILLR